MESALLLERRRGRAMGILAQVKSTRDLEHAYFNMLVYGPPGSGKTYMARTAVEAGHNVLFLDADHGTMTLRDQDVSAFPITNYNELIDIYKELQEGNHDYDTVFIDNLSEIQKMLIDQLKHEHGRKFGLHSWAKIVEKTSMLCRIYRSLSMNVVMLSHSMEIEDDNRVRVRPALSGKKLPHEISGLFDLVAYSHTAMDNYGNMAYRLGFATVGDRHVTKDRSGRLEAVEPNDFGLLFRKVFPVASREMRGTILPRTSRPAAVRSSAHAAPSQNFTAAPDPFLAHHSGPAAHPPPVTPKRPSPVQPIRTTAPVSPWRSSRDDVPVEGSYGTETWRRAILRFQQALADISSGEPARSEAICNYVKRTQGVASSTEMSADALLSWVERLGFMASSGDLDDYIRSH